MKNKENKVMIEEPFRVWDGLLLLGFIFFSLYIKAIVGPQLTTLQRSNLNQSLVEIHNDYFNESTAIALKECAIDSAKKARNVLGELFVNSRSIAYGFNVKGIKKLESHCLLPYFNAVRDQKANAWVINVLVCDSDSSTDPVAWHIDQTIALHIPVFSFAAHTVDVWYGNVPASMQGGELELARFSPAWLDQHAMRSFKPNTKRAKSLDSSTVQWHDDDENHSSPAQIRRGTSPLSTMAPVERALVRPRPNSYISFRGDAHHRVRPFSLSSPGANGSSTNGNSSTCLNQTLVGKETTAKRISIVLEQYRIPRFHYWNTVEFYSAT